MKFIKSILLIVLFSTCASVASATVVDVTAFGATGDDSSDDRAAIQAAIDSFSTSLIGGTVYFPPGLFNVSDTIYVPSNIKLQGTGSTLYNTQIRLTLFHRALFAVTEKGASNIVFKDLFLISMGGGWPRTTETETALIRLEGTVGISLQAQNAGLSNIVIENVRTSQFTQGISATAQSGFNAQITDVKIRNYVSDGNEYSLYTNTFGASNWDVQNMNVYPMYDKQKGIFLERSGQMRFLQLSCAGSGAICAKLWGNGDTYFRQMHVEAPLPQHMLGFCVGRANCDSTDPPGNMGENSSKLIIENSATDGEFYRLTNIVSINNRFWLDFPQPPAPPPTSFRFFDTGVNSSLKSCGNVWVSWYPPTHREKTTVSIPPWVFPGLANPPITACSNNDLTSIPVFNTGYDPDNELLNGDKDVRDYGATPDDGIDDTDAFADAIEAARTSRGKRVYVPTGTFNISDTLLLDRGMTIVGDFERPSEIRLHGDNMSSFKILNTPVAGATIMQGINLRNLLLTSDSDKSTIGIDFENYSPGVVGPASDFQIQNVDFDGFEAGIAVRPFGGVFGNANPMFDTVSVKDCDFTRNKMAILENSNNASNWNMEDIRADIPGGGEGIRINNGGGSIRNLSCVGDGTGTACVTMQRQGGTFIYNMTASGVASALDVPWENGWTQFPVTIRNSDMREGVYFQGRIYLNSVNNLYPAQLGFIPVPKVVTFGAAGEGHPWNDISYGGLSDIFSCSDTFMDPITNMTQSTWAYSGILEKPVTYCN